MRCDIVYDRFVEVGGSDDSGGRMVGGVVDVREKATDVHVESLVRVNKRAE
jgi:hypothetical protein